MTTTERSAPPNPTSESASISVSGNTNEDKLTPRGITFNEQGLLRLPSDMSEDRRESFSGTCNTSMSTKMNAKELDPGASTKVSMHALPTDMHPVLTKTGPSEDGKQSIETHKLEEIAAKQDAEHFRFMKSKRSSSASNDVSHERDRFRARFQTFNTSQSVIDEDDFTSPKWSKNGYNATSTKTKKMNKECSSLENCSADCVSEVLSEYSINTHLSPLNKKSATFKSYLPYCVDGVSKPETLILNLRSLTPKQLSVAFRWYFNTPLPSTSHMFPWLHGLSSENFAQRSFFEYHNSLHAEESGDSWGFNESTKPENARFIMCVETSPPSMTVSRILRNTVSVREILQRIEYSRAEVISIVRSLMLQRFSPDVVTSRDILNLSDTIISDCLETGYMPQFLDLDPKRGISLRNFHIQVNKAATCSDIIVYCTEESHNSHSCKCLSFARLLRIAQMVENSSEQPHFNVFIFDSSRSDIETECPEILTVKDSSSVLTGQEAKKKTQLLLYNMILLRPDTFNSWDADYQIKEKVETTIMSAATKLHLNVWSGNIWDQQIMMHYLKSESASDATRSVEIVPIDDASDLYCDPKNSSLTGDIENSPSTNLISLLPPPRGHWQLFFYCHNEANFPSTDLLGELLFKYTLISHKASEVKDIHQLDFPSSGAIGFGDCSKENLMSIVNTCKLIYLYSSSEARDSLATLIYCSDGYTESSLLIFCYLMYALNISLEEAMLKLHLDYGRPFYIFNTDVQVLRRLEALLRRFSPNVLGPSIEWARIETISGYEFNEIILGTRRSSTGSSTIPRKLKLGYIATDSDTDSSDSNFDSDAETQVSSIEESLSGDKNWVEEIEGSLPSKILPYIYLGSLKHANSLTVLSKIGISSVISVGESLEWLSSPAFQMSHDVSVVKRDGGNTEIYTIKTTDTKRTKNSLKNVPRNVMKVNNLQDDGIDDLSHSLPQILQFIDEEHKRSGGKGKILVHCRVGVSRSATVVIAEVMRRLKLNLPQAYLYVRVRRLNIVIQPNLRFMYELFKWEEQERSNSANRDHGKDLRVIDWFVMCQEIKKLNMPFISS